MSPECAIHQASGSCERSIPPLNHSSLSLFLLLALPPLISLVFSPWLLLPLVADHHLLSPSPAAPLPPRPSPFYRASSPLSLPAHHASSSPLPTPISLTSWFFLPPPCRQLLPPASPIYHATFASPSFLLPPCLPLPQCLLSLTHTSGAIASSGLSLPPSHRRFISPLLLLRHLSFPSLHLPTCVLVATTLEVSSVWHSTLATMLRMPTTALKSIFAMHSVASGLLPLASPITSWSPTPTVPLSMAICPSSFLPYRQCHLGPPPRWQPLCHLSQSSSAISLGFSTTAPSPVSPPMANCHLQPTAP